jgi:hypothetical protein
MTTDASYALYDETDDDTPIWNDLLDEFRDRLTEADVLYQPPQPIVTVELPEMTAPEPEPARDPQQPEPDPSGEPVVTPEPDNPAPLPGSDPVPGSPHPSDALSTSSPAGVAPE